MKPITIVMILLMSLIACSSPYKATSTIESMDDLKYPFNISKVTLLGCRHTIAYTDLGKGDKTILFIHGLGSYSPAWKHNIEDLSRKYRCVAIDLPGYGKSSKEPHSGKMTHYAGVIKEFLSALGIEKAYLAGHSMGGQISITTTLLYPEIVEGLILVAPAGFERFTPGQRLWFRDVMTLKGVKLTTPEAIINNLATNFYRLPREAEFMITDRIQMRHAKDFDAYCYAVVQSVNGMVDEPVIDYLQDIKVPTLIFYGENDNLIPNRFLNPGRTRDIAQYGAYKIQGSKLVMVPRCGHFMMFEKPEVFNQTVSDFIQ